MARKKKIKLTAPPGVDMLAFSSIMTIMLAFFIMLTSFIDDQQAELLQRATTSFKRAVSSFGLNSFIEKIGGQDIMQLDTEKFRQNFQEKNIKNINLKKDPDNNILEEDVEFDKKQKPTQTYMPTMVKFNPGDYSLNKDAKEQLDDFISLVADRPSKIIVEGRAGVEETSKRGEYMDWYLSSYRANSVAEYLMTKGRIDSRRISAIGYGKYRPVVEQKTKSGQNSFVSLIILQDN